MRLYYYLMDFHENRHRSTIGHADRFKTNAISRSSIITERSSSEIIKELVGVL